MKCRLATLDDYQRINALERRYNLGFWSHEEWAHIWADNPIYKRFPELPIGWVLEDAQQQIVGSMGSLPFGFELDGTQYVAAASGSWVADDRYRAYATLLLDRFFSQPGVDLHLGISPNGEAQPAVALHAERVPVGAWDRAALWITNSRGFAESVLAKKQVRYRDVLRYPAWAAVALNRAFKRDELKKARRKQRDHDVATCTAFDDRFDAFWEERRATNKYRLLFTRSREVLEWHYKYPLARNVAWISTVSDGARLVAYAVFCRKDVERIGLRRVRLIDYQSLDGGTALLLPILSHTLERCRNDGTAVLESIGWRLDPGDVMDTLAPYVRTLPSWQYFYTASNPALESLLKERDVWDPSQYEGAACL